MAESPRFLTLTDVAEILNISAAQTYALVRSGDLVAIKIGGRGQWRVERAQLEDYIARMYAQTATFVADHPLGGGDEESQDSDSQDSDSDDGESVSADAEDDEQLADELESAGQEPVRD